MRSSNDDDCEASSLSSLLLSTKSFYTKLKSSSSSFLPESLY